MKIKKKHSNLTTTRIIMLGFLIGIACGTVLLKLPISQRSGITIKWIDALFVAVSSISVTGLTPINIGETFNLFGQLVILVLIQIGGLGVITFTMLLLISMGKRISLSDRLLLMNAYNSDSISGLVRTTYKIVKISFILEAIGAVGYAFVFIPQYGIKGIWYSIFTAVSCFCNAGIDVFGKNSMVEYLENPMVNIVTMFLIIVSGLGFPVYWEIARVIRERREKVEHSKKLSLQAKIVFSATAVLIILGTLITLIFEWSNVNTIATLPLGKKIMASMFQSVTLRTAGFATIDQGYFLPASCVVYIMLMLIGGSPAGTAGGIKTVTFVVIIASMVSNIRGEDEVSIFHRRISKEFVNRCAAIATFSLSVWLILTTMLLYFQQCSFLDAIYEMASAIATVGLSRGLTAYLVNPGKIIVCLAMYLGRIGPITLALAFNYKKTSKVENAESKIIIG